MVMNCRPVKSCDPLPRSPAAKTIGADVHTHTPSPPAPRWKFVKKNFDWELANRISGLVGWNPFAEVPSPNPKPTDHCFPWLTALSKSSVPLSWAPPVMRSNGAFGSAATLKNWIVCNPSFRKVILVGRFDIMSRQMSSSGVPGV